MKRTFLFVFFVGLFLSCNKTPGTDASCPPTESQQETAVTSDPLPCTIPTETPAPSTGDSSSSVPPEALTWDADIYFVNFNEAQEAKVKTAVTLIRKVIASDEFRTRVLSYTYNGQKTFVDNGGLSNEEIYRKILEGAEKMGNTTKNNTMDVELELYYAATTTIGYTYPNSGRIWMNTKYFDKYTPGKVADNLTHEWLHKVGFGHATSYSTSRDHSVPYAIGYLVEELAAKY